MAATAHVWAAIAHAEDRSKLMASRALFRRGIAAALVIVGAEAVTALAVTTTFNLPASAQFFDDRYPWARRRAAPPPQGGGYFDPFQQDERPVDYSRAPAPKKPETQPTTTILVLGDSMADWLAYGLEDGLSETPEIGIVRKPKTFSGLIRYDTRAGSPEWPQVAREAIAAEKPQAVIMMIGLQDRVPMRDVQPAKPAPGADAANKPGEKKPEQRDDEQPQIAAPEAQPSRNPGSYEFRSEKWEELYGKRVDETMAALKSGNVPVLWVGVPAVRGTKSTSDMEYLNEFYRSRAEKAGIIFVDVWDGFVDDGGKFATQGPDFEGQIRRLRTGDGVHFTKAGARKLAHFVDRELGRVLASPIAVSLPAPETVKPSITGPAGAPAAAAPVPARPLAGPVLLLSNTGDESQELLGGGPGRAAAGDPLAASVLTRGQPITTAAGRADDFVWPPRVPNTKFDQPLPPSGPPVTASAPAPVVVKQKTADTAGSQGRTIAGQPVLSGQIQPQKPVPPQGGAGWRFYRPQNGFFGFFR